MEAAVQIMEDEGVEFVFGIPGAAILPLYQALSKSEKIRHIIVRHEEGGTHAADALSRVTGGVGVCIGTSGPAGTNMITGLYTAMADSIPIICITGQAPTHLLHKEAFQAVDIVEIAKPVTKWSVQVKETAQIPWVFREAFRIARSGRPGPVLIDLPLDVTKDQEIEYELALDQRLPVEPPSPSRSAIDKAMEMLLAAERPMIMPGGGVIISEASDELMELAEYLQVPVTPTYMAKGSIPEDHPLFAGIVGIQTSQRFANQLFLESDFVLAVGARFAERHTGDLDVYRGDRTFVHIDIEPGQIGRVFRPHLGIVADAKLALEALLEAAREKTPAREPGQWVERLYELRSTLLRKMDFDDVPIKPQRVFKEMNELFDGDEIIVTAIGLYQIWSGQFQKTYKPRHYLCCGQAGPLGWEVPACIGAKLGRPDNLVVGGRRRLLVRVPDGGDRRRRPVPDPVRPGHAQQRVHEPHPPAREVPVRHELRRRHRLRRPERRPRHGPRRAHGGHGRARPPDHPARRDPPRHRVGHPGQRGGAGARPRGDHRRARDGCGDGQVDRQDQRVRADRGGRAGVGPVRRQHPGARLTATDATPA